MSQGFSTVHLNGTELEKLSQLRAKTDQQLLNFIRSKLDDGLSFAALAAVEGSAGKRDSAEQLLRRADEAATDVQKLLPILSEEQMRELDPKLNELREALERRGRVRELSRWRTASRS
jgi:hypothetical protein